MPSQLTQDTQQVLTRFCPNWRQAKHEHRTLLATLLLCHQIENACKSEWYFGMPGDDQLLQKAQQLVRDLQGSFHPSLALTPSLTHCTELPCPATRALLPQLRATLSACSTRLLDSEARLIFHVTDSTAARFGSGIAANWTYPATQALHTLISSALKFARTLHEQRGGARIEMPWRKDGSVAFERKTMVGVEGAWTTYVAEGGEKRVWTLEEREVREGRAVETCV